MRKKFLAGLLALVAAAAFSGAAAAAGTEGGGPEIAAALAVRAAGAAVTTAETYAGGYSYEVDFRTQAADPNSNVMSVDLGANEGTHALRITVLARGLTAFVISNETGLGSQAEVAGDFDFPTMTNSPMGWMQLGNADYKFKFVTSADWSNVDVYCAQSSAAYPEQPNGYISLSSEDESKDYKRLKPTDGSVRLLPDLHDSFTINAIRANGAALDLSGGDVTLSKTSHFSTLYHVEDFSVNAEAAESVKVVSPFRISTEGFAAGDEVFRVTYDIHRGKEDGAAVWNTTAPFGLLLGMASPADGYTSAGVVSIANGAAYVNYGAELSRGHTVMAVGLGDGTAAEKLELVGRHDEETGAGTVIFRGNDLATGNVRVSAVGYAGGTVVVTYTEAVGHAAAHETTATVTGLDLNGYLALFCDKDTIYENDSVDFHGISVSVNEYVMPESVSLDKTALTVKAGSEAKLTAAVSPQNVTDGGVTWESDNETVATVSENGQICGVSYGTATITARSVKDPSLSASCTVTVLEPATGVELGETELSLRRAESRKLTASVLPAGRCDDTVTWESSDETVATVSAEGLVTAVSKGTATITAITADGGFTAACAVTVTQPATAVELDRETASLTVGGVVTLAATVYPAGADDAAVTWESDNEAVATVADGVVTAVSAGKAKITARCGELTAVCEITVALPVVEVAGIELNETALSLTVGETFTLIATVSPENATESAVVWSSDNEAVVTVRNGVVTAHKAGTAVITATAGGKTATVTITVTDGEKEKGPASCGCGTAFSGGAFWRGGGVLIVALAGLALIMAKRRLSRSK